MKYQCPYRDLYSTSKLTGIHTEEEKIAMLKRYGDYGMAAEKLGMREKTLRETVPSEECRKYLRKTPVISSEIYNQEAVKAWR